MRGSLLGRGLLGRSCPAACRAALLRLAGIKASSMSSSKMRSASALASRSHGSGVWYSWSSSFTVRFFTVPANTKAPSGFRTNRSGLF